MSTEGRQSLRRDSLFDIRYSIFTLLRLCGKSCIRLLLSVVLALVSTGCAVSQKAPSTTMDPATAPANNRAEGQTDSDFDLLEEELQDRFIEVADPLEPWNRMMFSVNDTLYFWVVKPIAVTYRDITPEPARVGIRNFFENAVTPARYVNCLLQGKNAGADTELRRFVINTTAGVLGFGDPALDQYGLKPVDEDLGQTLAGCGLGNGFYIVWPLLGPSTARDSVGKVGDAFLDPLRYVEPWELSIGISVVDYTNAASFQIGRYEVFKAAAVDPYIAMRESYIQYRDKLIRE
jgi:phospholipid-binding lipoprotein MlaA